MTAAPHGIPASVAAILIAGAVGVAPVGAVQFFDVTSFAGISHQQHTTLVPPLTIVQSAMSGGVSVVDYDGDGWDDLYFTRIDDTDVLYRNVGGSFMDVTAAVFGEDHLAAVHSNGCAWADIDNDGDQDLYVTSLVSSGYHLFINDGEGGFTEEAQLRGATVEGGGVRYGFSAAFGDYDNDGYLDLHVNEWRSAWQNTGGDVPNTRLLRNRGAAAPGFFEDVTVEANAVVDQQRPGASDEALAFTSRFLDIDFDGWPELMVCSDGGTSQFFWNDGDGTFTNGTSAANVGTDENGMGMAVGDHDGDGDFDWFVTSIFGTFLEATGNRLYSYVGGRQFEDVTSAVGVRNGGWGWGASFVDYDNDSDEDLFMANGMTGIPSDPSTLWRNGGGGVSSNVTGPASGIVDTDRATGMACLDFDRDGDLDLVVVNNGGMPILYRNLGGNDNDWLRLKLVGKRSNRDGIGAIIRVRVAAGEAELLRFVDGGGNYLGHNERTVHVGLGRDDGASVDQVEIYWPSGRIQVLEDVSAKQCLVVVEEETEPLESGPLTSIAPGVIQAQWWLGAGERGIIERSDDLVTWRKAGVLDGLGGWSFWENSGPGEGGLPAQEYYRAWK